MRLAGWRCFPWDPAAPPGRDGSPSYVFPIQRTGRFDLRGLPPVLYLAETAAHAVAEVLQGFRGHRFAEAMLRRRGQPLALASFHADPTLLASVADLTAPATLLELGVAPDQLASHHRTVTQAIARHVYQRGPSGFRWWSALTGHWHTTVLFMDHWPARALRPSSPEALTPEHSAVVEAREYLRLG